MPMGANGRRNDGSIQPAKWWRNGTKHAAAPPDSVTSTEHCMQTLRYLHHSKKTFNNLHKINFYVFMNFFKFCWKNLHLIVDTTQYCDTQQTIQNTKYIVGYIISFETFVDLVKAVIGKMVCLSWIGLGTGGSWPVCWQRQMMFVDSDRRWLLTATDDQWEVHLYDSHEGYHRL